MRCGAIDPQPCSCHHHEFLWLSLSQCRTNLKLRFTSCPQAKTEIVFRENPTSVTRQAILELLAVDSMRACEGECKACEGAATTYYDIVVYLLLSPHITGMIQSDIDFLRRSPRGALWGRQHSPR